MQFLACPEGLIPCLANGDSGSVKNDVYECVDIMASLQSCGGCSLKRDEIGDFVEGDGVDCTSLPSVKSVECRAGQCEICEWCSAVLSMLHLMRSPPQTRARRATSGQVLDAYSQRQPPAGRFTYEHISESSPRMLSSSQHHTVTKQSNCVSFPRSLCSVILKQVFDQMYKYPLDDGCNRGIM